MSNNDDNLTYGEYNEARGTNTQDGDRGIIGDTFNYLKGRYHTSQAAQQPYGQQFDPSQPHATTGPQSAQQPYATGGQPTQPYNQSQPSYGQGVYVSFRSFIYLSAHTN